MSTKINIKMNKNIEKSKNSIKKSNYNNIKLPTNQLKHLHNNNNLGNWEWTRDIEYMYIPPLLEANTLVDNNNGNIISTKPGLTPISNEEFLQHFCGFMDAEGSLRINIQEDRILFQVRISIHVDDKDYLLKVQ